MNHSKWYIHVADSLEQLFLQIFCIGIVTGNFLRRHKHVSTYELPLELGGVKESIRSRLLYCIFCGEVSCECSCKIAFKGYFVYRHGNSECICLCLFTFPSKGSLLVRNTFCLY